MSQFHVLSICFFLQISFLLTTALPKDLQNGRRSVVSRKLNYKDSFDLQADERNKRAEEDPVIVSRRRQSLIRALDTYFGFDKRDVLPLMNSEEGKQSKKKELIQGTVEMMLPAKDSLKKDGEADGKMAEMTIVLLSDDNLLDIQVPADKDKMAGIMDKMLSHMMKSDMSSVFEGMKGLMDGRKTDLVHGFDIPPMQELKKGASADPAGNKNSPEQNLPSSAIGTTGGAVTGDTVDFNRPVSSANIDSELEFTTLEVDLGPAILPLEVPEGYFVPFIPRQAFGVDNGVARPPHGHASFYIHRPSGLVDVPNTPAFGFLFSGQSRTAEIPPEEDPISS